MFCVSQLMMIISHEVLFIEPNSVLHSIFFSSFECKENNDRLKPAVEHKQKQSTTKKKLNGQVTITAQEIYCTPRFRHFPLAPPSGQNINLSSKRQV